MKHEAASGGEGSRTGSLGDPQLTVLSLQLGQPGAAQGPVVCVCL